MSTKDFTTTFLLDQDPEKVFKAVNNVRGWWSETVEGGTQRLNDEFIYRHKDIHFSKQKLVEVVPGKKVVWLVTESSLNFIENKSEWTGTKISFEISRKGDKTELCFTHHGLIPQRECYDACFEGWTHYLNSLHKLITTGKGKPDTKKEMEKAKS